MRPVVLAVILALSSVSFAQASLPTTMLASPVVADPALQNFISLVSNAAVTTPGQTLLYVDHEAMLVGSIAPITGQLTVQRGYNGTVSAAHNSGATVYVGSPSQFYTYDPSGACVTATVQVTPWINILTGTQWVCNGNWVTNAVATKAAINVVADYGAKGDAQVATDCFMTAGSAVLTCGSHFTPANVGNSIAVYGSGPTRNGEIQPLSSTIASYQGPMQVTLADAAGNSTTSVIATITTCSRASNVATCNTAANHNFQAGQMVTIAGINDSSFFGTWPILTVPTTTSFTFKTALLIDVASASGGTADGHSEHTVWGTDNTATLQAAVDAAGSAGGGRIDIPKGRYLTRGINMPCSQVGNFVAGGYYNCTIAYNNITFNGDGADVSILENWDAQTATSGTANSSANAPHPGLIYMGVSSTGDYDFPTANQPTGPLHTIEIKGLTLWQVKNPTNPIKPIFDFVTDDVVIHDNKIVGYSYEGIYQGGKSRRWDVHDNYITQVGLGGPSNLTSTSALNENGSESQFHNNRVDNSGQCMEGAGHDNDFTGNTCDFRGPDVPNASPQQWANLSSATFGLWRWNLRGNRIIGGSSGGVENVNGIERDIVIEGNKFFDITAGLTAGSGKETNNVNYGPQPPSPHGTITIANNTFTYTGLARPVTYEMSISGNQAPLLDNVLIDHNTINFNTGFCSATPFKACLQTADCTSGACSVPTGILAIPSSLGPTWAATTAYTTGKVVVPSAENTYIYMNNGSNCTSGNVEPTWCTTRGCTVPDTAGGGTCTWTWYGSRPHATLSNTVFMAPASVAAVGTVAQDIQITATPPAGFSFNNLVSDHSVRVVLPSGATTYPASQNLYQGGFVLGPVTFATLPAAAPNGTVQFCSDCNSTCTAGSSTGRTCFRENGAWVH